MCARVHQAQPPSPPPRPSGPWRRAARARRPAPPRAVGRRGLRALLSPPRRRRVRPAQRAAERRASRRQGLSHRAPHDHRGHARPRLAIRIAQRGVRSVTARVVFRPIGGSGSVVRVDLGRVRTGLLLHPAWPSAAVLKPGRYVVSLHAAGPGRRAAAAPRVGLGQGAADRQGQARAAGPAAGRRPARRRRRRTLASPTTASSRSPARTASAATTRASAPAARATSIRARTCIAAEGVPVVAPLAGTIIARDYQASAAGFYLTMDAADGRSFFFAHCQKDTFAVTVGQAVAAGQQLCRVGQTGDACGPAPAFRDLDRRLAARQGQRPGRSARAAAGLGQVGRSARGRFAAAAKLLPRRRLVKYCPGSSHAPGNCPAGARLPGGESRCCTPRAPLWPRRSRSLPLFPSPRRRLTRR